jgi:PAS domain S-box-containing protein
LNRLDENANSFTRYSTKHGLPSDTILCLLEGQGGNLWISTNNGLSKLNPRTGTSINYDVAHGLQSDQFSEGSCYKSAQGELFFGGINGFNAFFPDQITLNPYQPPVLLTDFRLFNESVPVGKESLLQQPVWKTDHLTLSYKDSIISFDFAALNYQFPAKNQYQYMLEGFETNWNRVDSTRRSATYTNLPAGQYIFRVKGSNNDGVWSDQEVALTLTVTPPWWKTWWAQSAFITLIVGLALGGYRWRVYTMQQQNRRLEQEVTKRTAELQTSESRYRELFDTMTSGVAVYEAVEEGQDFVFREFNRAGERIEGVTRADLIGKRVTEAFPGIKAFGVFAVFQRIWRQGGIEYVPPALYQDDQRASWRESWVYKLPSGEIVSVYNDVTERIETEQALQNAKDKAEIAQKKAEAAQRASEDANRAKSAFLANMSHELRTPLNAILGFAQLMQRNQEIPSEEQEHLAVIARSGDHLLTLINQGLDLSKIEAGRLTLNETDFDLHQLLDEMEDMFFLRAKQKGLHLHIERAHDVPRYIRTDDVRLRQVLINLLSNAVKFTEKGNVKLRIANCELRIDQSEINKSKICNLKFQISDTGIGIPSQKMEAIFQPFEQIRDPHKKREGTGLGLAISQTLVRMMGGELHVTSTVGQGATFWFDLNLPEVTDISKRATKLSHRITGYEGKPRTIVLADDKPENRALLIDMLAPLGFDVVEAVDGHDALDKAQTCHPDLLLIDLVMPRLDGFEVIRRIRQLPSPLSETIIISVSASVFQQTQQKSTVAGADDFLSKPVHIDELLEKFGEYLNLEWIYEALQGESQERLQPSERDKILPPPPKELSELYQLARTGNVIRLLEHLQKITASEPKFAAFGARLSQLADEFRLDEIEQFLQQYMRET